MVLNIKEHEQFFQKMCPKNVDYCNKAAAAVTMVEFLMIFL